MGKKPRGPDVSYAETARAHQEALQGEVLRNIGKTDKLGLKIADAAHSLESQFHDEVGRSFKTDCKKGCSYCCYQPATVFPFEALRIARNLRNSHSEKQLNALKKKMEARVKALKGTSVSQNINDKTACPLLTRGARSCRDDRCSIYDDRPLTCRLAHSFSVKQCRLSYEGDRFKVQIPISLELVSGVGGIIEGAFEGLPGENLDAGLYELCSAVLVALNDSEAALKWARGDQRVFAGCIKDDT